MNSRAIGRNEVAKITRAFLSLADKNPQGWFSPAMVSAASGGVRPKRAREILLALAEGGALSLSPSGGREEFRLNLGVSSLLSLVNFNFPQGDSPQFSSVKSPNKPKSTRMLYFSLVELITSTTSLIALENTGKIPPKPHFFPIKSSPPPEGGGVLGGYGGENTSSQSKGPHRQRCAKFMHDRLWRIEAGELLIRRRFEHEVEYLAMSWGGYLRECGSDPFLRTMKFGETYVDVMSKYFPEIPLTGRHGIMGEKWTQSPHWISLLRSRQAADYCGAVYEDWVRAVVEHYQENPMRRGGFLTPGFFYSERAVRAYANFVSRKYATSLRVESHPVMCRELPGPLWIPHVYRMMLEAVPVAKSIGIHHSMLWAKMVRAGYLPPEVVDRFRNAPDLPPRIAQKNTSPWAGVDGG